MGAQRHIRTTRQHIGGRIMCAALMVATALGFGAIIGALSLILK
jgi:hypothetical protein